jgi:transposase
VVRAWLTNDQTRPRKQRHTAVRIWERLTLEHNFTGSRRAVSDLVHSIRREMTAPEIFVPIDHPPGAEYQIDWGQVTIELNAEATRVMIFCARSAYSKATFVHAYLRDDMISFLDAHVWLFEQLGGVPKTLAYDNLSSAVTAVGKGQQRGLTARFKEMRSHYLYETRFCNVARGNEKGHVENSVKRAERTYFTPVPQVTSITSLNDNLRHAYTKDLTRLCSHANRTYGELLEEERRLFRPLPVQPFSASVSRPQKSDRQSTVLHEGARYSVPMQYACLNVVVRAFLERVEVISKHHTIASHSRVEPGQWSLELEHYLLLLERKPGLLDSGIPFKTTAWSDAEQFMRRELEYRMGESGTRQFLNMVLLVKEHPWQLVRNAIERCVKARAFNEQAVRLELQQLTNDSPTHPLSVPIDLNQYPHFQQVDSGTRNLRIYDDLLEGTLTANDALAQSMLPIASVDTASNRVGTMRTEYSLQ